MQIVYKRTAELRPYESNPRRNDKAVEAVAESIREFGFKVPIVVDRDGIIVAGHTRTKAAKLLGIEKVPVIIADDLDVDQIRAFRLADNKVAELATWDIDLLGAELDEIELDMEPFGFSLDDGDKEDYQAKTVERLRNIQNLEVAEFDGGGEYGIPIIQPTYELPEIKEWIPFNYVLSDKNPSGKGVHFFIHDYQFERVWNDPERYVDKLRQYEAVMAPDFSPYTDMPKALRIYNTYRRNWCAAYWQANGITVIPVVRACEEDADFCFEGLPVCSILAMSTMGLMRDYKQEAVDGYEINVLHPKKLLIYSTVGEEEYKDIDCDIEVIKAFSAERWR